MRWNTPRSWFLICCLSVLVTAPAAIAAGPPPEHAETRELMQLVEDAAAQVSEKGAGVACDAFREAGSRWFHDDVYVFINDMEGNSLCHPAKPSLEGRTVLDLRDPHGRPIVKSFIREVEADGEGWVHYLWPRPGAGMNFNWKTTYVRRAEAPDGSPLIVGSGRYQMPMERMFIVEQVDDAAELIREQGEAAFSILRDRAGGFRFYDSYVFVMTPEGVHLVNVGFPEHEGQNMLEVTDAEGKVIGREILEVVEDREAGWVDYMWPRPGNDPASRKSSYVRRVETPDGSTLIVGAGIYTD